MKPTWLIERGVYQEHAAAFKKEVHRQGMICAEIDYRPGKSPPHDILNVPPLEENACVVLWGTLPLLQQIQLHRSWTPGGWCNIQNLECATYYPHFRSFLLNSDYSILTGTDATRESERLFAELGHQDEIFVRPSSVHKLFPGKIVYRDDFRDAIAPSRYNAESQVVVSTPKEIGREWRLVVADNHVVASSQYRSDGAISILPGCPESILQFADDVMHRVPWKPDKVFMMDICESEGSLYVLELNSFSCSGLYACDLPTVIHSVSTTAYGEWKS